jgi:ABC-type amino acid transport substrate-binding protein
MLRMFPYCAALVLAAAAATLVVPRAVAADVFELEPDYVYGRNRRPHLGYHKPQVFDPLSDQLYQSGYRDFPPTAIPDELKQVDALTRVQKMGRIVACADAWFWPYSRTAHNNEPPGLDIELLQTIAKKHGWEISIAWANTGTRFGLGPAFAKTIDRGICDIFLGLTVTGDDSDEEAHHIAFTKPYLGTAFVLVTQGPALAAKTLDDVKSMHIKVGVPVYSPMQDYVQANGFEYETFFQNTRVVEALLRGDINAAMIWSGAISQARLEHPEAEFQMPNGYVPGREMRWNNAWGVKEKETELRQFIDEAFTQMLKNGEIKRLVERYGMPYFPPFEDTGGAKNP